MRFHLSHLHRLAFEMVWCASQAHRRILVCAGFPGRSRGGVAGWDRVGVFRKPARGIPGAAPQRPPYDLHCRQPAPPNLAVRYSLSVPTSSRSGRSPTIALLLGLVITLAVVVVYSAYIRVQLAGLRKLQSDMVDRGRKDSLQLLRLQNDLNIVALAMRDMLDTSEPYPLVAWSAQFERVRADLDAALRLEEQYAEVHRTAEQRAYLSQQLSQF